MRKGIVILLALCAAASLLGQTPRTATGVIDGAAEALGGRQKLLAVKSIKIEGDTKALFESNKKQLDEWNRILDQKYPKKKTPQEVLDESASHLKSLSLDPAKFTKSESGIWTFDVKAGDGAQPQPSNKVKVYCTGYLANGTKFWSTGIAPIVSGSGSATVNLTLDQSGAPGRGLPYSGHESANWRAMACLFSSDDRTDPMGLPKRAQVGTPIAFPQ